MENGWRMKPIHRLIVTSAAYRRGSGLSEHTEDNLASDPDNTYYWRANTRQMEAEVVRDSLLACSGELDASLGGQELDAALGLTSNRRSLYFAIHGEGKMQFLETFDAPDVCDCYQRPTSVRPQQALALANNTLALNLSRRLALKLCPPPVNKPLIGSFDPDFITSAFETVLSRAPTAAERQLSIDFLDRQRRTLGSIPAEELSQNIPEGTQPPASDLQQRARETFIHALFNHNDFVTIR
jgi:hypothetical protein